MYHKCPICGKKVPQIGKTICIHENERRIAELETENKALREGLKGTIFNLEHKPVYAENDALAAMILRRETLDELRALLGKEG